MPKSVILVVVIMSLIVGVNLWAFVSSFGHADAAESGVGGRLAIGALVLIGLLKGNRLAWQWGRFMAFLAGLGSSAAILIPIFSGKHFDEINWIVLGIPVLFLTMVVALGRDSARAYFGLICPKCGKSTWRAADFFFTKAKCKPCDFTW